MTQRPVSLLLLFVSLSSSPAYAWWGGGHAVLTRAAVQAAGDDIPAFMGQGIVTIAHVSLDPDVSKNKGAPHARDAEYAEHFLDVELLRGQPLPRTRSSFGALCRRLNTPPEKVGFLPYAISEWTERLAVAFAEHRAWPDNEAVRMKSLVYAGFLAHYAQDLCQPLHVTIHYDGRADEDLQSPRSGIHERVDALVERLDLREGDLARDAAPVRIDTLMPALFDELARSHALVDTIYALEGLLQSAATEKPDPRVAAFTMEQSRRAVGLTAALYRYAWERSARIRIGSWLDRKALDERSDAVLKGKGDRK